jgi:hypothetical protein
VHRQQKSRLEENDAPVYLDQDGKLTGDFDDTRGSREKDPGKFSPMYSFEMN